MLRRRNFAILIILSGALLALDCLPRWVYHRRVAALKDHVKPGTTAIAAFDYLRVNSIAHVWEPKVSQIHARIPEWCFICIVKTETVVWVSIDAGIVSGVYFETRFTGL